MVQRAPKPTWVAKEYQPEYSLRDPYKLYDYQFYDVDPYELTADVKDAIRWAKDFEQKWRKRGIKVKVGYYKGSVLWRNHKVPSHIIAYTGRMSKEEFMDYYPTD